MAGGKQVMRLVAQQQRPRAVAAKAVDDGDADFALAGTVWLPRSSPGIVTAAYDGRHFGAKGRTSRV